MVSVLTVPANGELVSFDADALQNGATQTINFSNANATEAVFSSNSAFIRISGGTPANTTKKVAEAMATLLSSAKKSQGLSTYNNAVAGGTLATGAQITVSNNDNVANSGASQTIIRIQLPNLTNIDLTCVTSGPSGTQFLKGANANATATNIAASITANTNFALTSDSTGTVTFAMTGVANQGAVLTQPVLQQGTAGCITFPTSFAPANGKSTVTFGTNIGASTVSNITFVPIVSKVTATGNDGNGVLATVKHDGAGGTFATGDIMCISGATDLNDNGLYLVACQVANVVSICPVGNITDNIKFCQSSFDTADETTADLYKIDLYVQIIAPGNSQVVDADSLNIAKGTLADKYGSNATLNSFASYTIIGAGTVSLQNAYTKGQSITVNAGDLTFNTLAGGTGDFVVAGAGDVTVTTSGDVDVGTSGNASITLGGTGAKSITTTTGNLTTTGTGNVAFTNTGDVGMSGTGTLSFANTGTQTFSGAGAFDVGTTGNAAITLGGTGAKSIVSTGGLTTTGTGAIAFESTGTFNVGSTGNAAITLGGTGDKKMSGSGEISIATTDTTANAMAITATGTNTISAGTMIVDVTATEGAIAKYAVAAVTNTSGSLIEDGAICKLVPPESALGSFDCVQDQFVASTLATAVDGIVVANNANINNSGASQTIIRINLPGNDPAAVSFIDFTCVSGVPGANEFQKGGSAAATQANIASAINTNVNFSGAEGSGDTKVTVSYLTDIHRGVTGNTKTIVQQQGTAGAFTFAAFATAVGTNLQMQNTLAQTVTFNYISGANSVAGQAINIGADDAALATASVTVINGHANFTALVNGSDDNQVDVTQNTTGTNGNGKTIATNTGAAITSISNFAGGTNRTIATAQATSLANAKVFGLVDASTANTAVGIVYGSNSIIKGSTAMGYNFSVDKIGETVYLDAATAGKITITPPATSTQIVYEIGVVVSSTEIMYRPNFVMIIG